VSVACCQIVSETGRSLIQTSPTECGVSEFDRESSIMRRPKSTRSCRNVKKKYSKNRLLK